MMLNCLWQLVALALAIPLVCLHLVCRNVARWSGLAGFWLMDQFKEEE